MSAAITTGLPPYVAPMTSAPVCTITGTIHNADGSPLVYGVVQFNSVIIQVVNSVVINPTVVSTVTDSAGNLSAVSLPQGLNVQVVICPSGNGKGTPSRASAAFTVWIPFAATADFGTLTQGVALTTSGSLANLTVSNAINVSNTSGASQITFGPTTTNVWGSVTSSTTNELALASGAYRTATGWVASAANPTVLDLNNGQFSFDANTGLTVGNTFTPTPLITIDPTGGMHMVGVPGLEVVSGGTGTKTAPTVAQILVAQSTTAYAPVTVSGDATLSAAGVLTVSHINGATPVTSFQGRTGAVSLLLSDVTGVGGAPTASPVFSGNPTAPTPTPGDNDTSIATTAFVTAAIAAIPAGGVTSFNSRTGAIVFLASDIPSSVALAGSPTTTTQTAGIANTTVATTAFVMAAVAAAGAGFTAGGDLSGSSSSQNVIGIRNTSVPALASGYLHFTGTAFVWDAPSSGFTASGDLSGTSTSQTVVGIQTKAVPTPVAGYLQYTGSAFTWSTPSGTFTAGGDLSGTATSQTVIGIRSISVPALSSGYLHYNGTAFVWDTPSGTGSGISSIVFSTGLSGGTITTSGTVALIVPVAIANGGTGTTTAPTTGQIITAQSASAYGPVTLSGDATITSAGTITVTRTSGTAFGTAATQNTGTSGVTIPLLSGANTWSAANTFPNTGLIVKGTSTGNTTLSSANASATNYTATFPANTGTIAELNLAQTWSAVQTFSSAPVMSGASITSATIPMAALTGTLPVANGGLNTSTAPTTGQIITAQSVSAYGPVSMSGDATITSAGAITVTKTSGTAFTALATAAVPLSIANGGTAATTASAALTSLGAEPITVSATSPPVSPVTGQFWWESAGAQLYIWTGVQWVVTVNAGSLSGSFAPLTNPTNGQNNYAPLASPTFTGTVTLPSGTSTSSAETINTQLILPLSTGASQIWLGNATTPWGSISAAAANNVAVGAGAYKTATQWIPTATTASLINWSNGTVSFYNNVSLTVGTAYTPTIVGVINSAGLWSLGALAAGASFANVQLLVETNTSYWGIQVTMATGASTGLNMNFTTPAGAASAGSIQSTTTATTYGTTSDGRFKTNYEPFLDGRKILDRLPIQWFDWISTGERSIGVPAQDVKDIFPEAIQVGYGEPGDEDFRPYGVDFSKYVPLLIQALQDAHRRIDALQDVDRRLAALEARLA